MSKQNRLARLFLFFITLLVCVLCYHLFQPLGLWVLSIAYSMVLFVLIFFYRPLLGASKALITFTSVRSIHSKTQFLEQLNLRLNKALTYNEVTQILFEAFDYLFHTQPYAFYIFEDDKFVLNHHGNINDETLLQTDIKASCFEAVSLDKLQISDLKQTGLPAEIQVLFLQQRIPHLLLFPGHSRIFAFVAIEIPSVSFLRYEEPGRIFRHIQNKAGLILENTGLFLDLQSKHDATRKIIEVSQQILSSFDIKKILDFLLETLGSIINFDAAAIFLLEKSGKRLLSISSEGYDPSIIDQLRLKVGQGACGWVVETKEVNILDDVRKSPHYFEIRSETRSQLSLPLIYNSHVLGVICLESNRVGFFNQNQADILQLFAHLASIAIHNARQMRDLLTKKSLENELINAGMVQQKLLVQRFPHVADLRITAYNKPSKLVSGDLYDVIRFDDRNVGMAIGDVSGKGAAAALMMALILAGLRSQKKTFLTVCDMVYRLNNLLTESTIEGRYATFFYGVAALDQNKLYYTNAGHNAPLLIKANGQLIRLEKGGIVLGFLPDWEYIQDEVDFEPGDILIAFTDGVTEAMNKQEKEFGEQRLIDIALKNRNASIYEIKEQILQAVFDFSNDRSLQDDITLLLAKRG